MTLRCVGWCLNEGAEDLFPKESNPINAFFLRFMPRVLCPTPFHFHTIPPLDWATIFSPKIGLLEQVVDLLSRDEERGANDAWARVATKI